MRKGSSRFSDVMRQTGEGSDGIWNKPSKKLKTLNYVGNMDNNSIYSKRLKLPKKILDDYHTVNHVSVPRKLRSALQKRQHGYVSPSPSLTNAISRFEMPSEDFNKKLKDEEQHSTMSKSIIEQITIDEEEAIAGLLSLPRIYARSKNTPEINLNNKISEEEPSKSEDLAHKCVQIDDLNESINTVDVKKDSKDVNDEKKSRKRCMSHVYICRIIKDLQFMEGKTVISHIETKTDPTSENIMDSHVGINLNEAITASKTVFQYPRRACGVQPYFGNPFCDPSQWSRPVFPKQQTLMNPFIPAHSGCYVQPTMLDALGSKQQQEYKMQYGQRSSGYEENGGLFRADIPPTLKLTL